ncbi:MULTISPECIES: VOC family protein [Paraburkholderia]|uniref:VOC family protein n=1 Tax=Paraburkholderia madseniana TaxID=2599607 RepID=A0AAP5BJZ1_9BURK|nr:MULTISPECIES: VOC family protein [Paraburkholderia]MCX4149962.1 VOC family protein [Paraburkholderia madseniana]MDN7152898.1 VOC family protein [Paraburkholderia sp. WS6]MDQ6411780.1 VOC family protein [Paraburkholderia madseniana]
MTTADNEATQIPTHEESKGIVPIKFAHFVLWSSRFDETREWYRTVLNAHPSYQNDYVAFLTYDDEHHRVAIVSAPGLKDKPKGYAGFHHVAFTYANLRDLLLTHERLMEQGIEPYWAINHGPTSSLYYFDPDKNRVELQIDNFDTDEEGMAYCATEEFSENPIGVDFDPSDLLRRLRAGESETELKRRPRIGPRGMESVPSDAEI